MCSYLRVIPKYYKPSHPHGKNHNLAYSSTERTLLYVQRVNSSNKHKSEPLVIMWRYCRAILTPSVQMDRATCNSHANTHLYGYRAIKKVRDSFYQHKISAKNLCLNSLKLQYKKLIWFHALWTKRTSVMLFRLKEVRKWLNTVALSHFDSDYIILEAMVDDRGFSLSKRLSFLRLIWYWIMIFPCNSIVRSVRNSKFNEMYMELCKELSPFVGISVTEIYECAYLQ